MRNMQLILFKKVDENKEAWYGRAAVAEADISSFIKRLTFLYTSESPHLKVEHRCCHGRVALGVEQYGARHIAVGVPCSLALRWMNSLGKQP